MHSYIPLVACSYHNYLCTGGGKWVFACAFILQGECRYEDVKWETHERGQACTMSDAKKGDTWRAYYKRKAKDLACTCTHTTPALHCIYFVVTKSGGNRCIMHCTCVHYDM